MREVVSVMQMPRLDLQLQPYRGLGTQLFITLATLAITLAGIGAAVCWGLPYLLGGEPGTDGAALTVTSPEGTVLLSMPGLGWLPEFMSPWGLFLGAAGIITLIEIHVRTARARRAARHLIH